VPDEASQLERLTSALASRYRLERELGRGGMATVYLAHDTKLDRKVAVKVLHPELAAVVGAERFLREIKVTAKLQHPHILPLHDSGRTGGHSGGPTGEFLYYVMPYVDEESLRDKLNREKQLSLDEAARITTAVASALDYAHRHDVIHRDIKPENILLHEGEVMVADFGIALALSAAGGERLTETGLSIGTPAYMSPEQISGDQQLDGRSDVYALACVVYEMLAGEPPFTGPSIQAVIARQVSDPVPPLATVRSGIGAGVVQGIAKALAKTPVDRFSSCEEFAAALAAARGEGEPAEQGKPSTDAARGSGRDQEIHFCTAGDGVTIAYATVGEGPPLVKAGNWLTHLEFDWHSPMWRHWWEDLAEHYSFVRYDQRGCGLSDWDVEDMSFEAWVSDLEAVVDAAGLDRFALLGISAGGPMAIAYAVRHPERVTHLVLHGAYSRGWLKRAQPEELAQRQLEIEMVKVGWGGENPAFRQVFTTLFFPGAAVEQMQWFNDMQKKSVTPENAARFMHTFGTIDVRDLAPKVSAPTLVLHSTHDARVPFKEGRWLASTIPGARLVPLESKNHIPLEGESAWSGFVESVRDFLGSAGPV
jgi:serine/threonine protein kinase